MDLKVLNYTNSKKFIKLYGKCHYCNITCACYVSNNYYVSISQVLIICPVTYQEMVDFPEQIIIIDYLLSCFVVNDVKKFIQCMMIKSSSVTKCLRN